MAQQRKIALIVSRLLNWYAAHARDLPWRRTADPYRVLVSEIMLQQTQVKTVLPYWDRWMQRLPDLKSLARAHPDVIHKLWEGLGYYRRVRNLHRAARDIVEKHGGEFPRDFGSILALPGVGPYTAGAVCSIAFNQPTPILDGNVARVLTRVYAINHDPATPAARRQLWDLAEHLVQAAARYETGFRAVPAPVRKTRAAPPGVDTSKPASRVFRACAEFNQSLMELGALVCTPRAPKCLACPIAAWCVARRTRQVESLPRPARRPPSTTRRFAVFIVQQRGRILVRKRAEGQLNGGLWELPNAEIVDDSGRGRAPLPAGYLPIDSDAFCQIRHSITRYRVITQAFRAVLSSRHKRSPADRWAKWKDLKRLAFPSAHRKILERLEGERSRD